MNQHTTSNETTKRPAPCPHCGANMGEDLGCMTHPKNDCFLSEWEFDQPDIAKWNRRASLPPPSAEPVPKHSAGLLGELLARIHRDGGQRQWDVGTEQAVKEADEIVATLFAASPPIQVAPSEAEALADIDKVPYMIVFDDADRPNEMVIGGTRARYRYKQISKSWNAHLFVKIDSNSLDEPHPSAVAPVPQVAPEHPMALLRKIVDSDVGRDTLHKLGNGQGVETSDGKAWLAAKAATEGEVAPEQASDIDQHATAELHAILAQYPPESWAVRNRALEEAAVIAASTYIKDPFKFELGTAAASAIRALISKEPT